MTTVVDFQTKVAQKLRILAAGDPLEPEYAEIIGARYEEIHAQLQKDGLLSWSVTGDIPDFVTPPLVSIIAAHVADEFQLEGQFALKLQLEGLLGAIPPSFAERRLRNLLGTTFIHEPAQSEYF